MSILKLWDSRQLQSDLQINLTFYIDTPGLLYSGLLAAILVLEPVAVWKETAR